MKHYIKIKINTLKKTEVIVKLNKLNVDIKNIIYEKDGLTLEVLAKDLKRIKKYLFSIKIDIIDEIGIFKLKKIIRRNALFLVSIIFGILVFLILNNVIVEVNVIHENSDLRKMIKEDLAEFGVTPLSFKKSYDDYENIIEEIKNRHKEQIEWLEIDAVGMVINIRVEERIINNYEESSGYCHIIAKKSGIVKKILTKKGVNLVTINDFVNKGDILISGEVTLNEEVKSEGCAYGEVYAEVWYQVSANLPLNYEEKEETGKMRYNLMVKNNTEHVILKSRIKNKEVKNILLFKLGSWEFYLQKEYEVNVIKKKYTDKEAMDVIKKLIYEKLKIQGSNIDKIINEKVLKKTINNDNLDIDMFVAIEEQIGVKSSYTKEMSEE